MPWEWLRPGGLGQTKRWASGTLRPVSDRESSTPVNADPARTAGLRHVGSELLFADDVLLAGLGPQLALEADPTEAGAFVVARSARTASRLIFQIGSIPRSSRYTVCHRYEPFWMKPCAGTRLRDVPAETQFLLAELDTGGWLLMVPLIDEPWRFSLRGRLDVLIVDYYLGNSLTGTEVAEALARLLGHAVPTLILTGDPANAEVPWLTDAPVWVARKPMSADTLLAALPPLVDFRRAVAAANRH